MDKVTLGTRRFYGIPLVSGTPTIEATVREPSGTETTTAATLTSGLYEVEVSHDTVGDWTIAFLGWADSDTTSPSATKTIQVKVQSTGLDDPFNRA
jgi:hypothetical protein